MLCQPSPGRRGCSPFTLLHPLLGNARPRPWCHRRGSPSLGQGWCQTHCLCPCPRERTASAPGSWDLQCRAKVVGKKEAAGAQSLLPGFAGRPKKQLQGQRGACCPNQPRGSFMGPTAASWRGRTPSPGCAARADSRIALSPCKPGAPGCPGSSRTASPAHGCDPAHIPCRVLESHQREDHASQPCCKCPVLPAVSRSAGAGHCLPRDTPDPGVRGSRVRPRGVQPRPSTAPAQKCTSRARAMAQTRFSLAVPSKQGLSCGRTGLTSEQADLTSECLQPSNAVL